LRAVTRAIGIRLPVAGGPDRDRVWSEHHVDSSQETPSPAAGYERRTGGTDARRDPGAVTMRRNPMLKLVFAVSFSALACVASVALTAHSADAAQVTHRVAVNKVLCVQAPAGPEICVPYPLGQGDVL
jgi:hypothetical protein